jgi:hypothetical protein
LQTEEDVNLFIAKQMDEGFDLYAENLPYKFFMVENYQNGKGLVIMIFTHAFCDGVGLFSAF